MGELQLCLRPGGGAKGRLGKQLALGWATRPPHTLPQGVLFPGGMKQPRQGAAHSHPPELSPVDNALDADVVSFPCLSTMLREARASSTPLLYFHPRSTS